MGCSRSPDPPALHDLHARKPHRRLPFRVRAFHADNGSEYINHRVAEMLNKLHVKEFTKGRPRRASDNALVESKNGNAVRRWLGLCDWPTF